MGNYAKWHEFRKCECCIYFGIDDGLCHLNPKPVEVDPDYFCGRGKFQTDRPDFVTDKVGASRGFQLIDITGSGVGFMAEWV